MHRMVKRSSPHVNVMIIAGAVIFYMTVILFGVDENTASFQVVDDLCHARVWLCVIGFSLLFGTIFAKAWRIYYIYSNSKINKPVVRKWFHMYLLNKKSTIEEIIDIYLCDMYLCISIGNHRYLFIWNCCSPCLVWYYIYASTDYY